MKDKEWKARLCQNMLNLYDFMTGKDYKVMQWLSINGETFRSFHLSTNYIAILIKEGIIEKRRNSERLLEWQYRWVGPRPSMLMVEAMIKKFHSTSMPKREKKEKVKEGFVLSSDCKTIPLRYKEENGEITITFPTRLTRMMLTNTARELMQI